MSRKNYSTHTHHFQLHHFLCVVCCSNHCLYFNYSYKSQWIYNSMSSEYNGQVSLQSTLEMKRNLLWCFCRKTCSNSWKMKLLCLRDIDRIFVILYLWTSVFNTSIHYAILCFDRVSFIHSLILKVCLTLVLFSCAKTAQHSPSCSHTTWSRKSFVTELGQNCQRYLQRSGCM